MMEILLIRHGETDWNVQKRLQGHRDIPLNAKGLHQAAAVGQALARERLDAVVSSDLRRTMQTAQAIAAHHRLPLQLDAALRERCYGALEGLSYGEMRARHPELYALWRARDPQARYPVGDGRAERQAETLEEFSRRTLAALRNLAESHQRGRIAVVTHGGVLDCVYRAAKDIDLSRPRDFDIFNASVSRLSWNGRSWEIQAWCEVAHLQGLVLDEVDR